MPDTRAIASLNRQTKVDEDRRRWAIEQAIRAPSFVSSNTNAGTNYADVIGMARKIEDYVSGRTTT